MFNFFYQPTQPSCLEPPVGNETKPNTNLTINRNKSRSLGSLIGDTNY
jgi:hypothetical protein